MFEPYLTWSWSVQRSKRLAAALAEKSEAVARRYFSAPGSELFDGHAESVAQVGT